MSGGPQVFLGATPFCLIASPPDLRPPPGFRLPPDLRPPRGLPARETWQPSLRSVPRLEARPGPAGLVMTGYSTMSHVIPLRVFQILKSHRWNCNVFSGSRKLTVGNYVRLLFWLTSWRRSTDNETPHSNDAVRGRSLTMIRWPSASELPHRCTRRPTPRRRWVGSSRAGSPEVGST